MNISTLIARVVTAAGLALLACAGVSDAAVTVNKVFSPISVPVGGASTVTVTLQNSDTTTPVAITSASDDISTMGGKAILDTTIPPQGGSACGGAVTIAGTVVTLTGGTIPQAPSSATPGACTFTFVVYGNQAGNGPNTILGTNVVTAAGSASSITQTLQVAAVSATVTAPANVSVPVGSAQTVTYTISNPAANVALVNSTPGAPLFTLNVNSAQAYSVTSATSTCGSVTTSPLPTNQTGTFPLAFVGGSIPAGGSCTVTLTENSAVIGAVVNTTFPAGGLTDDQLVTNTSAASSTVLFTDGRPNISKSFNPTYIQPTGVGPPGADTSQLTITIQNVYTNTQLLNAAILDNLPAGVVIQAPGGTTANTCGGAVAAVTGSTSIQLTAGTVPFNAAGNATCHITVPVTAALAGTYPNSIPPANFSATGVASAFNTATASLTTTANGGSVQAGKSFNVGSAGVNQPVQVTLTFGSLASGSFVNGTFVDTFPTTAPAMIGYSDPTHLPASSGCGAPTLAFAPGFLSMSGSNISIASGGTCTITFWAVFPNTTPAVRTATNTATGSFPPTGGGANVNTSASANINELPTLTVVNYVASNQGLINQSQVVQGQISDPSGTTDTNAVGVFNLNPGSVVLASANPANFTLTNCPPGTTVTPDPGLGFFTVNAGTISQTCTITYSVIDVGGAQGTFTPAASSYSGALTGNAPIAATGTNNVTFSTSNINITKQFLPANNIHAGGVATAEISLTVQGVFAGAQVTQANGVTFSDPLPANMSFAPVPNVTFSGCTQPGQPAPSYAIAGSTITLSSLTLYTVGPATQTTCNVNFDVTSDVLGSPTNAIAAHAVTSSSTITNSQPVSASLTVLSGIEVQKTFTQPSLAIGSTEYLRFLITNTQTASSPNDGALTDNMPASLALASTTLGPIQAGDPVLCGGAITTGAVGSSSFVLTGLKVPGYAAPVAGQCVAYVLIGASPTAAANTAVANTIGAGQLAFASLGVTNVNPSTGHGTLTPAPNVTLTKAFAPTTIASGGTSVMTISIANTAANAAPLSALTVSDALPAGVTVAAAPAASTTCGPGTVTAVAGAASVSLAGGTVAANATCTIAVSVTGTVAGIYTNTIPASNVTSLQGATNGAPASAALNIGNISGVTLAKNFAPAQIATGGLSTLTVTISNTAASALPLSAIALTDSLPVNVVIAALPNATTTCTGGTVSAAAGGTTVGLAGASMTPNSSCTFSVSVTSGTSGIYINTIPAGAFGDAQGSTNAAPAQATLNVGNASGVGLAKTFTPAAIPANGTSVLTISIANNAPSAVALTALGLTDALPANVKVAATPNAATTCGGAVTAAPGATSVTLAGGALAATASCSIAVSVTSAVAGVYTNVIPANALTNAQNSTNDLPVQAILNVANASGIALAKSFAPGVIPPGGTSVLTITLANTSANAVPLTALALVDNLPANVSLASTPNAATTCAGGTVVANANGTVVTLSGASMAVGNTCTVTVTVTGTIPNTYTNTIPAGAIGTAQGATNGAPAQANLIIGQPALMVTKTSTPSGTGVSPGETIAYQIVVKNNGLQAETNAHVNDTLTNATLVPGSVTVNGQPEPDQVITAGQSFGSIAVGATVTIAYAATVNVGAATGASVTNTATIAGDQPCTIGQCTSASPPNTVAPPVLTAAKLIDGQQGESVLAGQTVVYTVTIANSGTTPAINTTITDIVPSGVSVVPGTVTLNGIALPTATLNGQTLTIPIGSLGAGKSAPVTFNAKIGPTAGNGSNTASVLAAGLAAAVFSNAATHHQVPATISVTKTASATTVTAGDRVDYQIVVAPVGGIAYGATMIVDTLPPGEIYAPGTARVNGRPLQPAVSGNTLIWTLPSLAAPATITYSIAIAPGVQQNTSLTNTVNVTAVAPGGAGLGRGSGSASVLVVQSSFGSCYPITGRVYLDANGSGRFQDPDVGLGGVHIYMDDGESVVTDNDGRYDFPCVHPGMHALRLDETTLPPGAVPYDDRNIDSEKSTRRLIHHIYDTTIIEDINFAVTGSLRGAPAPPPDCCSAKGPPK